MPKPSDNRSEWTDRVLEILDDFLDQPIPDNTDHLNRSLNKWKDLANNSNGKSFSEQEQQLTHRWVKLLENIDQSLRQADAANQAKSEMLANITHEIRTPLHSLLGYIDLLKSTPLAETQADYLEQALYSARILLSVVNNVLDFSKMEAGVLELAFEETELPVIFSNGVQLVQLAARQKGLPIRLQIDPKTPRYIATDSMRLQQILTNLLSNAVKFTDSGEVVVSTQYQSGILRISVQDTGIGITEEQKKNLFKPFGQGDSTITRRYGGTGLGLIISDMIARQMRSKILLDNSQPLGTTFYFDLPVQTSSEETWS